MAAAAAAGWLAGVFALPLLISALKTVGGVLWFACVAVLTAGGVFLIAYLAVWRKQNEGGGGGLLLSSTSGTFGVT